MHIELSYAVFAMRKPEGETRLEKPVLIRAAAATRRHQHALDRSQSAWADPSLHDQARLNGAAEQTQKGAAAYIPCRASQ